MRIIGIGLDLVNIPRVQTLTERWRDRFLGRVFTDEEREYCFRKASPYASLAGRFAAKEAILKALGTGWAQGIKWTDIQVINDAAGRPVASASGHVERLLRQAGVTTVQLSLSHDTEYAVAEAILTADG